MTQKFTTGEWVAPKVWVQFERPFNPYSVKKRLFSPVNWQKSTSNHFSRTICIAQAPSIAQQQCSVCVHAYWCVFSSVEWTELNWHGSAIAMSVIALSFFVSAVSRGCVCVNVSFFHLSFPYMYIEASHGSLGHGRHGSSSHLQSQLILCVCVSFTFKGLKLRFSLLSRWMNTAPARKYFSNVRRVTVFCQCLHLQIRWQGVREGKGREDLSDDITTTAIRTVSLTIWLFWHRSAHLTHLTPTCWQAGSEKDAQTQCCQISSPRHMSLGGTSWSCALINCWESIGVDVMRCSPILLLPIHLSLSQPTLPLGPFS